MNLPDVQTWKQWGEIFTDETLWDPVAKQICLKHGISYLSMKKGFPGTHAVFILDDKYVIKIYCPFAAGDYEIESELNRTLAEYENIPAPGQLEHGVFDDKVKWPYVIMEYKKGLAFRDIRDRMTKEHVIKLAGDLGGVVKAFHSLPLKELSCFRSFSWLSFIEQRRSDCVTELAKKELFSEKVLAEIDAMVTSFDPKDTELVLINADLTEDHVLLEHDNDKWEINSIIDVADAKIGEPEYEWIAVWFDLFRQDGECMEACLKSYNPNLTFDVHFRDKAFVYTFLHQFSVDLLETAMNRLGNPCVESIEQLRTLLWR